ncbi:hypothetical protein Q5P01_020283 [Channa striata]|uniref:Inositol-tetrakisphosphate 1-kinase n=1 Tax=Channa striata TaxID=64152 RepID=A0AA88LXB4_CHASR|nr:hypothetical protein Q5P01_020283 [Channa striata]
MGVVISEGPLKAASVSWILGVCSHSSSETETQNTRDISIGHTHSGGNSATTTRVKSKVTVRLQRGIRSTGKMQTFLKGRRVGYWLSEKKMKKLNFQAFADLCRKRGIEVVQLDLSQPLEDQGPLDVIIHKLTDLILEADQNDSQAVLLVQRVQDYIDAHPETIILDPLPAIRTLLDRCKSYQLVHRIESCMQDERICSPPFMVLNAECSPDVLEQIRRQGLTFPFICKTRVAHGTNSHEMAIIFSEEDLKDVKPPCVIQSFINHNAVLYKVFVVGDSYTVVERPSLKNFPAGPADRKAIFFNSHNVSKPESSSDLTSRENVEGVSQPRVMMSSESCLGPCGKHSVCPCLALMLSLTTRRDNMQSLTSMHSLVMKVSQSSSTTS